MLESLRSFVGSWVAKILLGLLVISFAAWGVTGSVLTGGDSYTVATVGETKVSVSDYLSTYNRNLLEVQRQANQRLTRDQARIFGVENRTMSNVVSFAVMDEFARLQGLALSEDTLARMIAENRAFHDSTGKFSRETFRQAVYQAQMRESDFIASQNASAIRSQLAQAFATGQVLPKVFSKSIATYIGEERKFSYIKVTQKMAGEPPAPTTSDLKSYFDDNKATYKAPEYRKIVVLKLEPADIADEKSVSDDDIAKDYEERKTSYHEPEKRRVQQIVFKSKEKADEAVKALEEGAVFESILEQNNLKASDADLGLLARDRLPEAIRETVFKLELNTVSDIVDGPFGPTLVRVTEVSAAKTTPLADVKDAIRKDIALRRAADEINNLQETVEDTRAGGASLVEAAQKLGFTARTVEAVDRTSRTPDGKILTDLPGSRDLLERVFQTEIGAQPSPIDVGSNGYAWFEVMKIDPSRDRTFDEVKNRVTTDWTKSEQAKLVTKKAEDLKKQLQEGKTLSFIANEVETEAKTTGLLKRAGEEAGFPRTATQAGFSGDKANITIADAATDGEKLLITVAEIKKSKPEDDATTKQQVDIANQGAADDLLNQLVTKLQSEYTITQNQALIDQVLTRR